MISKNSARKKFVEGMFKPLQESLNEALRLAGREINIASLVAVFQTDQREGAEKKVKFDDLTGLLRRSAFIAEVQDCISQSKLTRGCVIFFDIDDFKRINDNHGHKVGDEALQAFAAVLKEKFGIQGKVSRWGGEEFVVYLPNLSAQEALRLFPDGKMNAQMTSQEIKNKVFNITASGGISNVEGSGGQINQSIAQADAAMYFQKKHGKNGIAIYTTEMGEYLEKAKKKQARYITIQERVKKDLQHFLITIKKDTDINELQDYFYNILHKAKTDLNLTEEELYFYLDTFIAERAKTNRNE